MTEYMLRARQISFRYPLSHSPLLDGVDLHIEAGGIVGVCGKSGTGKSTLAKLIAGKLRPDSGSVHIGNQPLGAIPMHKRCLYSHYLPQQVRASFSPYCSVQQSLEDLSRSHFRESRLEEIAKLYQKLTLPPALATRFPAQLSGGELQRFAIVRALLLNSELVILDEPTSALDIISIGRFGDLLKSLARNNRHAFLIISHDVKFLREFCAHVYQLSGGQLVRQ